jgi:hypothetical protein
LLTPSHQVKDAVRNGMTRDGTRLVRRCQRRTTQKATAGAATNIDGGRPQWRKFFPGCGWRTMITHRAFGSSTQSAHVHRSGAWGAIILGL